jgi:methylated-DNA-[protein]-cysteine S-methyltransferase
MTPFAKRVYVVVSRIPRGSVLSYGEVARRAGKPGAARAVGSYMRRNPYPRHTVPCHRIIRADGRLGSYSGPGGVTQKARLLRKEGVALSKGGVVGTR